MRLPLLVTLLVCVSAGPSIASTVGTAKYEGSAAEAAAIIHDIDVTGVGASTFPSFDPGVERYAITTGTETGGRVTVTAATSDPGGVVTVNGERTTSGTRTVTGLRAGDEISVFIDDSAGRAIHSFVYLPADFPALERVTSQGGTDSPSPGLVMLTLGLWTQPSSFFETAVDANGVPAFVVETPNSLDLKRQPNGNYTVARGTGTDSGVDIVELDEQLREVGRHRTVGLTNTDGHDAILLPDGSRYLMAYEPNAETGKTDAVVQHVSAHGTVLFSWDSADHIDDVAAETVVGDNPDYAHINSIDIMDDGDLLLSFRHLSSVFKVARTAHDGYMEGAVIWKLGGRASDFRFTTADGALDGGPCAQHTATELPNGNILVFDNGAWSLNPLCVDPADQSGPPVERRPTRIAEWSLDETSGEATLVRDHQVEGRYAVFAGSVQPLDGGRSMVGWASSTAAVASELDADGDVVWELRAVGTPKYFTYRAFKTDVPDAQTPVVLVSAPAAGATYVEGAVVRPSFGCTDRGGASLRACTATPVDTTTPGTRTFTVSATDGAGNRTVERRSYRVLPRFRPDAMIRVAGTAFRGGDRYGSGAGQGVTVVTRRPLTAFVRIQNDGNTSDRFVLRETSRSSKFGVRLRPPGRSPRLLPGESWTTRIRVTPRPTARSGNRVRVGIVATSVGDPRRQDAVRLGVRLR